MSSDLHQPILRTYGSVKLVDDHWAIDCEPHVEIRLKRVFKRALPKRGTVHIAATEENSRDLEWFITRYPLKVQDPEQLERLARGFDRRAQIADQILAGNFAPPAVEMQLPPRRYQAQAAALCHANGSLLLADELGLGKTVSAIALLAHKGTLPALVVCPAHLPKQWKAEVERFLPFLYVHIAKRGEPYPVDFFGREPDVLIMSYYKLSGWSQHLAGKFSTVIFDECQDLRRSDSNKYVAARNVARDCLYRLGLSATPIYNYGDEFYSVIDVLRPDCLGTRGEFYREWCTYVGKERYAISSPKAFGTYLRDLAVMIRRTRKQVKRELPALQRVLHEVESDPIVLKEGSDAASELARIILSQGKGFEKMKAGAEFDLWMRQQTGISKAPYVAEFVKMLLHDDQPVVLFGWHRAVYDIWWDRLQEFKPAFYTGSESSTKKAKEVERFVRGETNLIIVSLRSGSGLDGLQKRCSRAVIGELDWSPGVIEQCIGRVYRDGQENPVLAYYLVSGDGSDPVMADILDIKRSQIDGVKEPFGDLVEIKEVDPNHVKRLAEDFLRRRSQHRSGKSLDHYTANVEADPVAMVHTLRRKPPNDET